LRAGRTDWELLERARTLDESADSQLAQLAQRLLQRQMPAASADGWDLLLHTPEDRGAAVRLAETPVTNRHYGLFLETTSHNEPEYWRDRSFSDPEQPVVGVSWDDGQAFCAWLAKLSGLALTLPSEAQWEFAGRGDDGRTYPWADEDPNPERACYGQDWQQGKPSPVGSHQAGRGPFGTLDQAGNVSE
jgi:formylglycine-generating enzyme required for sulfatase activity